MTAQFIAEADWSRFCEEFSRQHRGWLLIASVTDKPLAAGGGRERCAVCDARFRDLSFEPKINRLSVALGEGAVQITQSIPQVSAIRLLETGQGAHAGLRIDSAGNRALTLRFRAPALPENLNGVFAPWL